MKQKTRGQDANSPQIDQHMQCKKKIQHWESLENAHQNHDERPPYIYLVKIKEVHTSKCCRESESLIHCQWGCKMKLPP